MNSHSLPPITSKDLYISLEMGPSSHEFPHPQHGEEVVNFKCSKCGISFDLSSERGKLLARDLPCMPNLGTVHSEPLGRLKIFRPGKLKISR